MENILSLKDEFKKVCEKSPIVYKVEDYCDYFQIYTKIFIDFLDSYLNLYLIFEDKGPCLSDSNEIYRIFDGPFDITNEMLEGFSKELNLDYNHYRFTKFVSPQTIENEIKKFEKLRDLIISNEN